MTINFKISILEAKFNAFENVEILDRANTQKKLELKEMLYIRKLKPSLNKQLESELFTLIIRNVKLINSATSGNINGSINTWYGHRGEMYFVYDRPIVVEKGF